MSTFALVKDEAVYSCIEAEQDVIDLFNQFGWFPQDEEQVNITGMSPRPGIGWTYSPIRTPQFRAPAPDTGSVWVDEPPGDGHWGTTEALDPSAETGDAGVTQPITAN